MHNKELIQGSPEWLEIRRKHIGASDAPVIMEVSPWRTPYQLWEEKLNISPPQIKTESMQRGIDFEEAARVKFTLETGYNVTPNVRFSNMNSFMMASLDGLSNDGKIAVEIKCPSNSEHEEAKAQLIPEKYFPQLQHQMNVLQIPQMFYASYDPKHDDLAIVECKADLQYQEKMIEKESAFYDCMITFVPPELSQKDWVDMSNNHEWNELVFHYKHVKQRLDQYDAQEKALRNDIISLAGKRNAEGSGLKITKSVRKGNIQYDAIPELDMIDLEKYRKPPTESFRISVK